MSSAQEGASEGESERASERARERGRERGSEGAGRESLRARKEGARADRWDRRKESDEQEERRRECSVPRAPEIVAMRVVKPVLPADARSRRGKERQSRRHQGSRPP